MALSLSTPAGNYWTFFPRAVAGPAPVNLFHLLNQDTYYSYTHLVSLLYEITAATMAHDLGVQRIGVGCKRIDERAEKVEHWVYYIVDVEWANDL